MLWQEPRFYTWLVWRILWENRTFQNSIVIRPLIRVKTETFQKRLVFGSLEFVEDNINKEQNINNALSGLSRYETKKRSKESKDTKHKPVKR